VSQALLSGDIRSRGNEERNDHLCKTMKRYLALLLFLGLPLVAFASLNTKSFSITRNVTTPPFAYIANDFGLNGGTMTMEGWIYLTANPASGEAYGVFHIVDGTNATEFQLRYSNNFDIAAATGFMVARSRDGVAAGATTYTVTLSTATWYHIVMRYDGTDMKLFTAPSGGTHTERATVASSGSGSGWTNADCSTIGQNLYIRSSGSTCATYIVDADTKYQNFNGLIDDVRVWNTSRSLTEMDDNDEKEMTGTESGLVAYYKMSDNLLDSTSGGFNMTAQNSPGYSTTIPFAGTADFIYQLWAMSLF
jgi:hypothetical protein